MAENAEQSVTDVILGEEPGASAKQPSNRRFHLLLMLLVIVSAGAGGFLASRLRLGGHGATPEEAAAEQPPFAVEKDEKLAYHQLDPVIVNLKEDRVARYVRATLVLAMHEADESAAKDAITKRLPELRNWLILYLADRSPDEVKGARDLNRILRDVHDSFNEKLWPTGRPLIHRVYFKEWAVQ